MPLQRGQNGVKREQISGKVGPMGSTEGGTRNRIVVVLIEAAGVSEVKTRGGPHCIVHIITYSFKLKARA
ncbi:unnamed protein product, partial [Sphenostylis stenocarpa]